MISVLAVSNPRADAPPLADDLRAAGLQVLDGSTSDNLVRDALQRSPDVVVCWEPQPDESWFRTLEALATTAPRPLLVFTADARVESMDRALVAGVQVWVVQGYDRARLRSLVQLAQRRHAHERALRDAHADLQRRFEERKLVDRAKGILMRASRISEDEAFRVLRSASMQGNRRVGQVSQQVIEAARYADAINRAGQLRMLSQRVVKLHALALAGVDAGAAQALLAASLARADANLDALDALLSKPTYGDLQLVLRADWTALRGALAARGAVLDVAEAAAETALQAADRLVVALESAGFGSTLHVINLSGRQRMLTQRYAKQALLAALGTAAARAEAEAAARQTAVEFEQALAALRALPLATAAIRSELDRAAQTWAALQAAARRARDPEGQRALAGASEALLELFEQLTDRYESSMQVLIGPG